MNSQSLGRCAFVITILPAAVVFIRAYISADAGRFIVRYLADTFRVADSPGTSIVRPTPNIGPFPSRLPERTDRHLNRHSLQ
jgi:hypothetical protein